MGKAKRHHYVTKEYLNRFSVDEKIWVIDQAKPRQFQTNIKNAAVIGHFNSIEIHEDSEKDVSLETEFSNIESNSLRVIEKIVLNNCVERGEEFDWLLNHMAILGANNPSKRRLMESFRKDIVKRTMDIILADKSIWKSNLKKAGLEEEGEEVTYEEMKKFVEEERFTLEVHKNVLIEDCLNIANKLVPLLGQREWGLLKVVDDSELITTDNPMSIHWINPVQGPYPPGFGLKNTIVIFPLDSKYLLFGVFYEVPGLQEIDSHWVAQYNSMMALKSGQYLYSKNDNFLWVDSEFAVKTTPDLLYMLQGEDKIG